MIKRQKKFQSTSRMDAVKIGQVFLETKNFFLFRDVFLLFFYYLHLENGLALPLDKPESLSTRMLCAKFGWPVGLEKKTKCEKFSIPKTSAQMN